MVNVGTLPLGFRFRPTDIELINHFLRLKNGGKCNEIEDYIKEVDLCKFEPWDLPDLSAIKTDDCEWFFFCPIDRKHHNAQMLKSSNRATRAGYWKATGKDRTIKSRTMGLLGMKKTLVFYRGRAPKGQRTNWIIHEYRPDPVIQIDRANQTQAFVLCRLFKKDNDLKQSENDGCRNISEMTKHVSSPNQNNISELPTEDNQVVETGIKDGTKLQIIKPNGLELPHDGTKTSHDAHVDCDDGDNIFSDTALDRFFNPPDDVSWLSNFKEAFAPCRLFKKDNDLKQSENDDCCNISEMTSLISSPNQNNFLERAVDDDQDIDQFLIDSPILDSVITLDDLDSESGTRDPPVLSETDFCENGEIVNASEHNEHRTFNVIDEEATEFQYDGGITSHCNEPEFRGQHLPIDTQIDDDIFSDQALDRFCNSPDVDDMTWLPSFGAALWQVHSNLSSDNEGSVTIESSLSDDFEESGVEDNEGTVTTESSLSDDFEGSGVEDTSHSINLLDLDKLCRTPLEAEEEVSRETHADISNQRPRRSISVSSKGFRCVLLVFMIVFLFIACIGLRKAQIAFIF